MESFLYEGTLRHRRFTAPTRDFEYSLFMAYLDLGELDSVFAGRLLWSTKAPNLAWFRRADHYGDPNVPLDVAIRDLVLRRTGSRPAGPIPPAHAPSLLRHCFNPVSFYYCFGDDGRTLETVVAEVNNTPWGERHMYVLPEASNLGPGDDKRYELKKEFHVSPFLAMDMDYRWRFAVPGERLVGPHGESAEGIARVFEATLSLSRRPVTGPELARALVLHPAMTVQVLAGIYFQALRLWLAPRDILPAPSSWKTRAIMRARQPRPDPPPPTRPCLRGVVSLPRRQPRPSERPCALRQARARNRSASSTATIASRSEGPATDRPRRSRSMTRPPTGRSCSAEASGPARRT